MLDDPNEIKVRALELAIKANAGASYDENGRGIIDADKIIAAATKFETYLKGTTTNV